MLLLLLAAVKWIFLIWLGLCVISGLGLALITLWQAIASGAKTPHAENKQTEQAIEQEKAREAV